MVSLTIVGVFIAVLAVVISLLVNYMDQRKLNNRTTSEQAIHNIRMDENIIIITGSNTGIGKYTAKVLVQSGAHIILACRNSTKAETAKQSIISELKPTMHENEWRTIANKLHFMHLDLNSLASVKAFATAFEEQYSSLNILINNAGVMAFPELQYSMDGYEKHFAINHLGHFYLTMLLTPIMQRTSGIKRVLSVASGSFRFAPSSIHSWFKFENIDQYLQNAKAYGPWNNYGLSKACNILFGKEYNRRFSGSPSNIYAFSLHPGVIATEMTRYQRPLYEWIWINIVLKFSPGVKTFSQGSATTIVCATMNEREVKLFGGHFFQDCNEANSILSQQLLDDENARLLWVFSDRLLEEKGYSYT